MSKFMAVAKHLRVDRVASDRLMCIAEADVIGLQDTFCTRLYYHTRVAQQRAPLVARILLNYSSQQ